MGVDAPLLRHEHAREEVILKEAKQRDQELKEIRDGYWQLWAPAGL